MAFVDHFIEAGPDECWLWTSRIDKHGYGRWSGNLAHRLAYTHFKGPIPAGLLVCHTCDNPVCVNPAHLWLGTNADNARDKVAKGRARGGSLSGGNRAKLTTKDALEIRRLRGTMTQAKIAAMFGVGQNTVSRIQNGHTWAAALRTLNTGADSRE